MPTFRQDNKLGDSVPLIKTPDIGDKQVTERKLADGSVTSSKLSTEIANMLSLLTTRISAFKVADNLSSLPTEENTIGWLVDNHLYVYVGNGSTPESGMYQDCGELRGPQGIQGEQGLSGLNGKSAYDIWAEQPGNEDKSEIDFLEFTRGSKGDKGDQGERGYDISNIEQIVKSTEDGGKNIIRVTRSDGWSKVFEILNGSKGSKGDKGTSIVKLEQTRKTTESSGLNTIEATLDDGTKEAFEIYNGAKGDQGDKGEKGDKGDQGEIGPQGNSGITDASSKNLINDAITGGETDFLSAEVGKLGILTYDCSKGGTITHATLQDAINSVPTTFQKVGLTITYKSGNTIYSYTLKANTWSADPTNWFSVVDKLGNLDGDIINLSIVSPTCEESTDDSAFAIADEDGNAIAKFEDGDINTKNFDSKVSPTCEESTDDSAFAIADEDGNAILIIDEDGTINGDKDERSIPVVGVETTKNRYFSLGEFNQGTYVSGTQISSASNAIITDIIVPYVYQEELSIHVDKGYKCKIVSGYYNHFVHSSEWLTGDSTYSLPEKIDWQFRVIVMRESEEDILPFEGKAVKIKHANNYNILEGMEDSFIDTTYYTNMENCAVLFHVTDLHGDNIRLENCLRISELAGADAVLNTGDTIAVIDFDGCKPFIETCMKYKNIKNLYCLGNHESYFHTDYNWMYNFIFKELSSAFNYRYNKAQRSHFPFYYVDLPKKIRVIALDQYRVDDTQKDWLCETLLSTPKEYGVVLIYHQVEARSNKADGSDEFFEEGYNKWSLAKTKFIVSTIDAFISREKYGNYDFSSVDGSIEFIAHINGHEHEDLMGYLEGTKNTQLQLNSMCGVSFQSFDETNSTLNENASLVREPGKINENCFNSYIIDRNNKTVRVFRFGATERKAGGTRYTTIFKYI